MTTIEQDMRGKTAIVTGGGAGIGKGCAALFCASGVNVVIADRRAEAGEAAAGEIAGAGAGECLFFECDVSDPGRVEALVDFAVGKFGGLDAIVNNAGFQPPHFDAWEHPVDDFKAVIETNLVGMFYGCKFAIPHLRRSRGAIVNMASVLARVGQEQTAGYSASKGGVISMTQTIAIEEARHGVRVNAICPGHIVTEIFELEKERSADPAAYEERCNSYSWLGRGGTPEDIAHAALFLCSSWASYITGTAIMVTGGLELGTMPKRYYFDT